MKLIIDTEHWELRVSREPEPKIGPDGVQRTDKSTGQLVWTTQLFVLDETGGDVITVSTVGEKPDVKLNQIVDADKLEAIPWSNAGRSGVSFRAEDLYEVDE